ncbi:DUF6915 family protein [Acinetobacter genomosp. 15BJ]|uniref:DUF6915 domain-containing protein n=1 Tax=Acinetobacter genomosp. 15BJ TaxID=106651 RepID=R9AJE9_9GAMM|nr:hypothetical protein [Acinetobacter genomosp. 15BJ]EOR02309.1 hypothetical protein F896_03996 [Acinetobacter genomosp. 15BJ]MCH7292611.1 hypothetical protein [Acinetobacter genomosp. 15BJ]MDO3657913.1 hypothetical protein [Acinetobacter genomosp. 15BJ]
MNAMQHARISAKRWGGEPEDYYELHAFIDSTKSLCSDARHRILHTLWGINSIVVPVFGHSLQNSAGKSIDIKDLCERDHLLVDYQQRFILTLNDFVNAINPRQLPQNFERHLEALHHYYVQDKTLSQLMLSPLALTGKLHSLLLTHNSWFIYDILPRIGQLPKLDNIVYSPADFFNAMHFELWMDNGMAIPASAQALHQIKQTTQS